MLEIKCPTSRDITGFVPEYYHAQVQGQLEVCGLEYCDFLECELREYDKALEVINKAIDKDDKSYIAKLIKSKLLSQKTNNEELINNLDELINSLIKNERFQILNSSNIDKDYKVLFEFDE